MTAAILSIGTELTRGEIVNTNSAWLADRITSLGQEVTVIETVADDRSRIVEALERLGRGHRFIVCTGGLGPTTDDITSECVAALLGVKLERHAPSLDAIHERMARAGREMAESNRKQADFPAGSLVLTNPNGTAPGFSALIGKAAAFFLPGVPAEMKPMFEDHVAPAIGAVAKEGWFQIRLKTFGQPESAINDRLADVERQFPVTIGYRAHFPEIEVKVLARAATPDEARSVAEEAARTVRDRLSDVLYGEGTTTFAESVGTLCRQRGLTIGTAESCTGGLVASLLTEPPGASDYFVGSIVSYANEVKMSVLGVDEAVLIAKGAVSAEVARAMADGARRVLGADVALALTGIAGPAGGTPQKPVGLVHLAVAAPSGIVDERQVYSGNRLQVQRRAAFAGLAMVRRVLLDV